jgi:integral membrane protein (TIGR01906 family)
MKKILNHGLTILLIFSLIILMITISIGLPIYFRPFYYLHINGLEMVENTGWSYEVIKEAYDQVLDFLVLNKPFGTGLLKYSEEGKAHFVDCKVLFDLNFWCLVSSLLITIIIFILSKLKIIEIKKYLKFDPIFYSSLFAILIPVVVGILASIDFDRAFEVFHTIFFPGKNNWLFDPRTDEIILVMPQDFFMHCAILIGASLLILTLTSLFVSILFRIKRTARLK